MNSDNNAVQKGGSAFQQVVEARMNFHVFETPQFRRRDYPLEKARLPSRCAASHLLALRNF